MIIHHSSSAGVRRRGDLGAWSARHAAKMAQILSSSVRFASLLCRQSVTVAAARFRRDSVLSGVAVAANCIGTNRPRLLFDLLLFFFMLLHLHDHRLLIISFIFTTESSRPRPGRRTAIASRRRRGRLRGTASACPRARPCTYIGLSSTSCDACISALGMRRRQAATAGSGSASFVL